MKHLLIKCSFPSGACSYAHPGASVGPQKNCAIYKITEIPEEVNAIAALLAFERTVIASDTYEVKYADIGPGKKV